MEPILALTDLSPRGDLAVARAAMLAEVHGAPLHILHVVEDDRPGDEVLADEATAQAQLEAWTRAYPGMELHLHVETGHPSIMIPRLARQIGAGLAVFGAHRHRGVADWVGRPNLVRLLGGLEIAALVAHLPVTRAYGEVLVGWDFTKASDFAADLVGQILPLARLGLGHAVAPTPMIGISPSTTLADLTAADLSGEMEALHEAADQRGASALWHHGAPAAALRLMAQTSGTDLIAVGRHRRGPLERLILGETAMALATDAPCDLLVAPPL